MESKAAASLYVWLGRFLCVRGFRVQIASGESLDSEIVEHGDDDVCEVRVDVVGDLMISRSRA